MPFFLFALPAGRPRKKRIWCSPERLPACRLCASISLHHQALQSPQSRDRAPRAPMPIIKKKGKVEGLYRIGQPAVSPVANGNGNGESDSKHEVYYVRGRPFIAPSVTGTNAATTSGPDRRAPAG